MKKIIKNISLVTLALMVMMMFSVTAFAADGTVTYNGAGEFAFGPGSELSETQLFPELEGAMPGDELEQKVTVTNDSEESDYINIYLNAEVHDEEANPLETSVKETETVASMSDFLSQLTMTVTNGSDVIFEGTPDIEDGLSEPVKLGKLYKGESLDLVVKLSVPADLGNEYANRSGEVDWVFTVDELDENASLKLAKTVINNPADKRAYLAGEEIQYEITAENDGNVLLTNVIVMDELTGDEWQIESLSVGEKKTFTTSYKVTDNDAKAGTVENVATAEADVDNPDIGKLEPQKVSVTSKTAVPEPIPEKEDETPTPKTGDETPIMAYAAIFGTAIVGLFAIIFRRKNRA